MYSHGNYWVIVIPAPSLMIGVALVVARCTYTCIRSYRSLFIYLCSYLSIYIYIYIYVCVCVYARCPEARPSEQY